MRILYPVGLRSTPSIASRRTMKKPLMGSEIRLSTRQDDEADRLGSAETMHAAGSNCPRAALNVTAGDGQVAAAAHFGDKVGEDFRRVLQVCIHDGEDEPRAACHPRMTA